MPRPKSSLGLALLALVSGCVVYEDPYPYTTTTTTTVVYVPVNTAPYVLEAEAFVFYDPVYDDDIWAFEAVVDDPDGLGDVIGVWADVYDDLAGGRLVESFELYPTSDPYVWYSEWLGRTSTLDPFWPGYSVDLVVYDTYDDFGWLTVPVESY